MTAFPLDAAPTAPAANTVSDSPLAGVSVAGDPVGGSPAPTGSWFLADAAATAALGAKLAAVLPPGATLLLHGELGAGKTTLVQGMAAGLGVEEPVTSPSFALAQHYGGLLSDGRATALVHLDLYRLEDPASAAELFAQEEEEAQAIAALLVVEWASRLPCRPEPCWQLQLRLANAADPEAGRWACLWGAEGADRPVAPSSAG
jgi:tRNA threonylcarbamoyladenosine biosynthesis protein TsaE